MKSSQILLSSVVGFILLSNQHCPGRDDAAVGIAPEGEPFRAVQDALLKGDTETARRELYALPAPPPGTSAALSFTAKVSLLEAAMAPFPERARALLSVAEAFGDHDEGLTALVACLSTLSTLLRDTYALDGDNRLPDAETAAQFQKLLEETAAASNALLYSWRRKRPTDLRLGLVDALLEECQVDLAAGGQARIGPVLFMPATPQIPVPAPLAEEVRIRLHELSGPHAEALIHVRSGPRVKELLASLIKVRSAHSAALDTLLSPGRSELDIPCPPPSIYLMEVRSETQGLSRFQVLVVTALELVVHTSADGFALLATIEGDPAAGVEVVRLATVADGTRLPLGRTDERGLLVAPFPEDMKSGELVILASKGPHRGTARLERTTAFGDGTSDLPEQTAHLFLDRSIYRPGETVQGRVVMRRHTADAPLHGPCGGGTDSAPVSSPLIDGDTLLEVVLPDRTRRFIDLEADSFGVAVFEVPIKRADPPGAVTLALWISAPHEDELRKGLHQDEQGNLYQRIDLWRGIFDVQEFRRAPLLVDVAWPQSALPLEDTPEVGITARYPSGAAAAGLAGTFTARLGDLEQTVPLHLDRQGTATVTLALAELDLPQRDLEIPCSLSLRADDGQTLTREGSIALVAGSEEKRPDSVTQRSAERDDPPAAPWHEAKARSSLEPKRRLGLIVSTRPWLAGADIPVTVTGPPRAPVLITLGRACLLDAQVVVLGADGTVTVDLPTREAWRPRVFVAAAMPDSCTENPAKARWSHLRQGRFITLAAPRRELVLTVKGKLPRYAPGEEACWTLVTNDSHGDPVPTTVALSVLDERLALLMGDALKHPARDLFPDWCRRRTLFRGSDLSYDARALLETVIVDGRVRLCPGFTAIGMGGPCGATSRGPGAGPPRPRVDFRSTAFFAGNVTTGPDGLAQVRFAFPDDLTTWRIMAVAVDHGRRATFIEDEVRTVRDPALTPVLPRLLRAGDRVTVHTLAHAAEGTLPPGGRVTFGAEAPLGLEPAHLPAESDDCAPALSRVPRIAKSGLVETGLVSPPFPAQPGKVLGWNAALLARSPGSGVFQVSLQDSEGALLDQIALGLPVRSRDVVRSLWTTLVPGKDGVLEAPRFGDRRPIGLEVEVFGGIPAWIEKAEEYLEDYPYGCAEQVASRVVPLIIALHPLLGARSGGPASDAPVLTPLQTRRLEAAMSRLRGYQKRGGGFTWWGSGPIDPEISACVYGFLALLKEAGVEPAAEYGLRLDPDCAFFKRAHERVVATTGGSAADHPPADANGPCEPDILAAEIVVARLLVFPDHPAALAACQTIAARGEIYPDGLLARCGRALACAGKVEAACGLLECLRRRFSDDNLWKANPVVRGAGNTLLESPAARLAAVLELVLAVDPQDPLRTRLLELLARAFDGDCFDHTFGTASTLVALRRDSVSCAASLSGAPFEVEVSGKDFSRTLVLGAECGWRAACACPVGASDASGTGRLVISNPSGQRIVVVTRADLKENGARAAALAQPIVVERRLMRLLPDVTGALKDREPAEQIRVGDTLEAVITVKAPEEMRYLVLDSPVPAGFEVMRTRSDVVVRDDRAVLCVPRTTEGRLTWRLRLACAMAGRVAWPPVEAAAMYDPRSHGRSAGTWLESAPAAACVGAAADRDPPRVKVLTRSQIEGRIPVLAERLAAASSVEVVTATLRAMAALPVTAAHAWLDKEAPRVLGPWLREAEVARVYLGCLVPRAKERVRRSRLAELVELALDQEPGSELVSGTDRNDLRGRTIDNLARGLAACGLGPWALEMLGEDEERNVEERFLFELACLYDDEALFGRDLAGFLERLRNRYRDLPEEARTEVFCDRIGAIDFSSEERTERLTNADVADAIGAIFWAFDRVDLQTQTSLGWTLWELLEDNFPRARTKSGFRKGSIPALYFEQLRRRIERGIVDVMLPRGPQRPTCVSEYGTLLELSFRGRTRAQIKRTIKAIAEAILERRSQQMGREELFLAAADSFLSLLWSADLLDDLELERLDALALPLFYASLRPAENNEGDPEWCWLCISRAGRQKVPNAVLLTQAADSGEEWAAEQLLRRGGAAKEALVLALSRIIEDDDVWELVVGEIPAHLLRSMALSDLLRLAPGVERWWDDDEGTGRWRRLRAAVSQRHQQNHELAEALARSRDPAARFLLVQVLADRRIREVPFAVADRAAPYYRNLLHARLGDEQACREVEAGVLGLKGARFESDELLDMLWALEPSLTLEELIAIGTAHGDLEIPAPILRSVLARTDPARLLDLLADKETDSYQVYTLLEALPRKHRRVIARGAVDLDLAGSLHHWSYSLLEALVGDRAFLERICRSAPRFSTDFAGDLVSRIDACDPAGCAVLIRFLDHSEAKIRHAAHRKISTVIGAVSTWLPSSPRRRSLETALSKPFDAVLRLHTALFLGGAAAADQSLRSNNLGERVRAEIYLARAGVRLSED